MWGTSFMLILGGVGVVLLVMAIAFGTSAALFPVLIAAAIGVLIAIVIGFRRSAEHAAQGRSSGPTPRSGGAPASGEGSGPPASPTGARPS